MTDLDVLQYDSCRDYLQDFLKWKRTKNPRFGVRWLAKRAQLGTPSSLSMILSGKRPMSENIAEKLVQPLGLFGRRKKYFLTLRKLDSATKDEEIYQLKEQLMELKSAVDQSLMEVRHYKAVSEWYYVGLYVLLGMDDVSQEIDELRKRLNSDLSSQQITQALEDLEELGLIEKIKGRYRPTHRALTTEDEVGNIAMYRYHEQMIERAKNSIGVKSEEREFCGITIGIPKKEIPWLKKKIRDFRQEINETLSQHKEGCELYQININVFPLVKSSKQNNKGV